MSMKTMMHFIKKTMTIASMAAIGSSCSTMKKNDAINDASVKKAEDMYQNMQVKKPSSLISRSKDIYLTGSAFKIEKQQILPPIFSKNITYTTAANETLESTINQIGKIVDLKIRLTPEATTLVSKMVDPSHEMKSYHGKLSKVLDQLTIKAGLFWDYQNGVVKIFSVETKVYALDAPIADFNLKNSISSSTSTNGSGGDSATDGSSTVSMDSNTAAESPWKSAITTIKSMLSPGGRLDTNPVEGYVTVTDNPERQREIRDYVKKINDKTNKKIAIRVDVYDVQTTNSSQYGLDMNAVVSAMDGSVAWASTAGAATAAAGTAGNSLTFTSSNGSTAVINALNTVGKATQTTGTTIYTISGQPAPIQNSQQQNYLRSISTTTSDNDTTVSMDPGTITTGYSMTITPRISSNNEILIALNLQISTLVKMDTFSVNPSSGDDSSQDSSSQQIQLPTVHTKSFLENVILKSGQTILIAGFQDDDASTNTNSMGEEKYWALGGSKNTSHTKSTTVVVVTPYIIE